MFDTRHGQPAPDLDVQVTADDIEFAGLTGHSRELIEAAIHTALDRLGGPRDDREVHVTYEFITIDLSGPALGWADSHA